VVNEINSVLVTFPLGIRAQVMESMYSVYRILLMQVPTPAEIGQLVNSLVNKPTFKDLGLFWYMSVPQSKSYLKLLIFLIDATVLTPLQKLWRQR
jgi:Tfp pilus assembly protein PilO